MIQLFQSDLGALAGTDRSAAGPEGLDGLDDYREKRHCALVLSNRDRPLLGAVPTRDRDAASVRRKPTRAEAARRW